MLVRSLRLRGFRNYAAQELELPAGLVALTGDNGQGKTNLLEALCVLATTKSPLVDRDRELIRWGDREARLAAEIELTVPGRQPERRLLEYSWRCENTATVREMRAGGVPQSQIAQWLGQLQVVAFFPHDLAIITGEPEQRRRFLNLELGKTRPAYFTESARFRRALKQRNALLRHLVDTRLGRRARTPVTGESIGSLSEWNRQVITHGARVLAQRAAFVTEIGPLLARAHRDLCGRDEALEVEYLAGVRKGSVPREPGEVTNWSALLSGALEFDHEVDMRRGTTQSGPQRDDLVFKLGGIDLRRYGSQGQQRLAVLALKIALAHWVARATGEAPVLLLDDALSELDAQRRARLLAEASRFPQSVLTTTDAKFLRDVPATFFTVLAGSVREADTIGA